jgi:hypothetical protein
MNVILLHTNHRHVSATHVAIFRAVNKKNTSIIIRRNQFTLKISHNFG